MQSTKFVCRRQALKSSYSQYTGGRSVWTRTEGLRSADWSATHLSVWDTQWPKAVQVEKCKWSTNI